MPLPPDPDAQVLAYHERTKHRLERYAPGPDALDWDAQPAAFRSYAGTQRIPLPLASELDPNDPSARALTQPFSTTQRGPHHDWTLNTVGVLLQLSFGITAWKSYGPDRWAVRANPSSGNLHPSEIYVVAVQRPYLADGIYHYDPEAHALELRACWPKSASPAPALYVALTSIMWREAWKYGERAFRYCQLDTGHAAAAVAIAANALGASVRARRDVAATELESWLGLTRTQDFPHPRGSACGREEPELLLQIESTSDERRTFALSDFGDMTYFGTASVVDARPMYRWPVIDAVAQATRAVAQTEQQPQPQPQREPALDSVLRTGGVLLGRRSAQRFDPHHALPADALTALLAALLPSQAALWRTLQIPPAIDLVLFVHRVAELKTGLYVLPRRGGASAGLLELLSRRYSPEPVVLGQSALPLLRLCESEPKQLMRVTRALHCHQDIAANSCLALAMVAEFAPRVQHAPSSYRDLLREAGLIGQLAYVHAEAHGLRGTGIGCFFDDEVHALLGLSDTRYQSLYHFTIGHAIDDLRIETAPAYPGRQGDSA